jgi:hypothetical protein
MTKKARKILFLIALTVLVVALALLVYSFLPVENLKEIVPITPTYLVPPAVAP